MKIYFGFTMAGDRTTVAAARGIVQCLEELGHEVLTRHLVNDDARTADRSLGPAAVYQRDTAWLGQCDLFIGEISGSSFGLGFEAGYLLGATSIEVILLYDMSLRDNISFMALGNTHPNCTLVPYSTLAEAEAFIRNRVGRAAAPLTTPTRPQEV